MNKTVNSRHMLDAKPRGSPFSGWEWLKTPALLLIVLGTLGIVRMHTEVTAAWMALIKFPPMWVCCMMIGGGVILMAVSAAAYHARYRNTDHNEHETWRTL